MYCLISINDLEGPSAENSVQLSSCWRLHYYYEGTGHHLVDESRISFCPGVILIQPPNLKYRVLFGQLYKCIVVEVKECEFDIHFPIRFEDTPQRDFFQVLRHLQHQYFHLPYQQISDALLGVLKSYLNYFKNQIASNSYPEMFEQILIENISNPHFYLPEAIEKIPISPNHFRFLFKQKTGRTPLQYLEDLRMNHAASLLANCNTPINEVALLSGYSDPYYFSRVFKKRFGKSPAHYRMSYSKKPEALDQ